ncbi:MAG: thiopeptide-type bacteriocin biosynthesis protein [Acidobacteriota bacterium]
MNSAFLSSNGTSSNGISSNGAVAQAAGSRWQGFYLYPGGAIDPFLADQFFPFISSEREAGRLRRFFFLRHQEGGMHLRLRLQPTPGAEEALIAGLEQCAAVWTSSELVKSYYDRTEHYFGETPASVYSELLNESTSWLTLRLLRSIGTAPQQRMHRWLTLTSALDFFLRRSTHNDAERRRALQEGYDFSCRAAVDWGHTLDNVKEDGGFGIEAAASVEKSRPRVAAALAEDQEALRIAALLRRLRHNVPKGSQIAVHALHLFCNKFGFHLGEEHAAMVALLHLDTART